VVYYRKNVDVIFNKNKLIKMIDFLMNRRIDKWLSEYKYHNNWLQIITIKMNQFRRKRKIFLELNIIRTKKNVRICAEYGSSEKASMYVTFSEL
jgi:hypothetical protein